MAQALQSAGDVGRLINLVPVGLKEAALDSPTARASVVHYSDQVDILEKWLDDYAKAANRLVAESLTLENVLNGFIAHSVLPTNLSEAMLDHDYSILAMRKYGDAAKDYWMSMIAVVKRLTAMVIDPIRHFLQNDLRAFREARRAVDATQKTFEHLQTKFAALGKSKEPSSLREEAFQLHEARKLYLKAIMDFFTLAPQFRFALDRLLVRIFFDQWREMRISRDNSAATFQRNADEMQRIKGWLVEMDTSERVFRNELLAAKKQLEDAAEAEFRPSRELEDYTSSTIPQYAGHGHSASSSTLQRSPKKTASKTGEKQGWLFLRTYGGKPTRTIWVKRWAFVRNGVFGWLLQATSAGGVEESERIGVLLCNARPAPAEERRFCFELKTNRNTIVLQAETQSELVDWLDAFNRAKSKAVDSSDAFQEVGAGTGNIRAGAAFAISAPPLPEFGASILTSTQPGAAGDDISGLEKTHTLPLPSTEHGREGSIDVSRRSTVLEEGAQRDTASRILSKLDLHRKSPPSTQVSPSPSTPNLPSGIAGLIAASHGSMPVGPSVPLFPTIEGQSFRQRNNFTLALRDMPASTLAPSTLASVPSPTNLSRSAVIITGERGLSPAPDKTGIPAGILANTWGSSCTGFVNRLERSEGGEKTEIKLLAQRSPVLMPSSSPPKTIESPTRAAIPAQSSIPQLDLSVPTAGTRSRTPSPSKRHRSTISGDRLNTKQITSELQIPEFPNYYPLQLKSQDAQFRLLFPTVKHDDRLVLVFRATWNPSDKQDFPGRVYVTSRDVYFYSNHLGLVLTSCVSLAAIDEATAAPGRDYDFIFLHLKEVANDASARRVTIKTFLEPLRLLQRRLNFLIKKAMSDEPTSLEEIIKTLIKMETDAPDQTPSLESWEDVSPNTPVDTGGPRTRGRASTTATDVRGPLRVDRALHQAQLERRDSKFKLPAQPVKYTPPGNLRLAVEKEFDISAKALFHVMFGDKSLLWQILHRERRGKNISQGPWLSLGEGRLRRDIAFDTPTRNFVGQEYYAQVRDYQVVDVSNDHLCYVVTDKRTPWHLPYQDSHRLVSKIVITHVAKAKCKLAVFAKVEWLRTAWMLGGIVERQAIYDLELDSQDLADLVSDQVRKLGAHSRTKKAILIFGQVGQSTETTQLLMDATAANIEIRRPPITRTMTGLLAQSASSSAGDAAGSLLQSLLDFEGWFRRTVSANKIVLLALILSTMYNTWHTYRDSFDWWHERRAGNFMARLGISPNAVMSRAVYISDLDEVLHRDAHLPDRDSSACYSIFHDEHDPQYAHTGPSHNTAIQVQQTRQRLGTQRHDLLVAVRVVNSIEKELLFAAWHEWVIAEHRRCQLVEGLVLSDPAQNATDLGEDLQSWYNEYCTSCQDEYLKISG